MSFPDGAGLELMLHSLSPSWYRTIRNKEKAMRRHLCIPLAIAALLAVSPALAQEALQPSPAPAPASTMSPEEPAAGNAPEAAPAKTPELRSTPRAGDEARGRIERIQAFSAASLCDFPPDRTVTSGKRFCWQKSRAKLVEQASAYVEGIVRRKGLPLSPEEILAFADSMLTIRVVNEDVQKTSGGLRIQMTLQADEDLGQLERKLALFTENADVRQKALADYRARNAGTGGSPNLETVFPGQIEERARDIDRDMRETARFAEENLRAGMGFSDVAELLGDPRTVKEGAQGENYICMGYGRIWVVFKDGLASCLRTRLDYNSRHRSDCHCAGRLATIIPFK